MTSSDAGRPHPTPEQLASVPLLASLNRQQLSDLAELIDVVDMSAGRTIVSEGATGYAFYVLADGAAEVRHGDTVVRTLGPGDHFGEVAMIEDGRRSASVVTVGPCVVWSMFGTTFRVLEAEHPEIAKTLQEAIDTRRD
jgi:CRP/FNR family transcriptional regulator, cyclic AMP receptor protein